MNKKLKKSLKILLVVTVLMTPIALGTWAVLSFLDPVPEVLSESLNSPHQVTLYPLSTPPSPGSKMLYGAGFSNTKTLSQDHAKVIAQTLLKSLKGPLEAPTSCNQPTFGLAFEGAPQHITAIVSEPCKTIQVYTGPTSSKAAKATFTHNLDTENVAQLRNIFFYHGLILPKSPAQVIKPKKKPSKPSKP